MEPDARSPVAKWFYVHNGRRHGPADVERIIDLILSREITEETPVWHPGLSAWTPAREVEAIRAELPPPVPAAPGAAVEPQAPLGPDPSPRRRRRKKHRHNSAPETISWVLPIGLLVAGVLLGLMVLFYRMNRVAPGGVTLP